MHGAKPGPTLWLNGATHGDEPEGPQSIFLALREIDISTLAGTVVAVPVMNVDAFTAGERGDPLDTFSHDMNRIYPGKAEGYTTERIAWAHWQAMKDQCDLQIAIHSGGNHSYLSEMIFASLELAAAMGPEWRLVFRSGTGAGNPSSQLAHEGKGATTVELGGQCRTLADDFHWVTRRLADGYLNVMRHYKMIPGEARYAPSWYRGHQIPLLSPPSGMFVSEPGTKCQVRMAKGTLIGRTYNLYGDVVGEVKAPEDGLIFGLRHRPSIREGDWCCFYGVVEEERTNLIPGRN